MIVLTKALGALLAVVIGTLALPAVTAAQSAGSSGMGAYTAGYGGARYSTARPQTGSTRDANGNRLIVDGIIRAGAGTWSSVSGGVSLMAMTALAKAGARMIERYDTSVSEMELRYANNRLIGDDGPGGAEDVQYRRILAGSVPGTDFYIIGGITEVNYNIRSGGFDMAAGQVNSDAPLSTAFAGKAYVMNIGIDLRLIQTTTLEVVDVVSYQKQIIGREISAGVFDFLDGNVFDISAGDGGLEPVQLAVRALIERATVEFMANLYGAPGPEVCLNAGPDPLGGTVGPTGGFYAAYPNTDTNNGETRADPSRWHDRRDDAVRRSRY